MAGRRKKHERHDGLFQYHTARSISNNGRAVDIRILTRLWGVNLPALAFGGERTAGQRNMPKVNSKIFHQKFQRLPRRLTAPRRRRIAWGSGQKRGCDQRAAQNATTRILCNRYTICAQTLCSMRFERVCPVNVRPLIDREPSFWPIGLAIGHHIQSPLARDIDPLIHEQGRAIKWT